jgi:hypothetical protein
MHRRFAELAGLLIHFRYIGDRKDTIFRIGSSRTLPPKIGLFSGDSPRNYWLFAICAFSSCSDAYEIERAANAGRSCV